MTGPHLLSAGALAEDLIPFLAEHDRQVSERVWDDGWNAAVLNGRYGDEENPYRAAKEEQK